MSVYVIAEIGINHEGSLERCLEIVDGAKVAGANAVKIQIVSASLAYAEGTKSYDVFKNSQLTAAEVEAFYAYCKSIGLDCGATFGDVGSLHSYGHIAWDFHKISSGLIDCVDQVNELGRISPDRDIFVSTGMSSYEEIDIILPLYSPDVRSRITLLQCSSIYPCPVDQINLGAIAGLRARYSTRVGFSDHSISTEIPALAVAAGAQVIEKHLTFDTARMGYDHAISLSYSDFGDMVTRIRYVECLIGSGQKLESDVCVEGSRKMRRKLVYARSMPAGHVLTEGDLICARIDSLGHIPARLLSKYYGKMLLNDAKRFDPLEDGDIQ